jgi:hypothetical protein
VLIAYCHPLIPNAALYDLSCDWEEDWHSIRLIHELEGPYAQLELHPEFNSQKDRLHQALAQWYVAHHPLISLLMTFAGSQVQALPCQSCGEEGCGEKTETEHREEEGAEHPSNEVGDEERTTASPGLRCTCL